MGPKNIFICYRRDDAEGYAGRLYDRLNYRFPRRVFMDVTGIRPGADFSRVIQDTVGSCHVLIAIMGKHWATITDDSKRRRLEQPNDYVRREIATALSRNITVIPVLVRGAEMPSSELLPPDLAPLSLRNALEITDGDFDHDVQRLIEAVEIACGEPRPLPPAPIKPQRSNCLIVAIVLLVVGGLGALLLFGIWISSFPNDQSRDSLSPTPILSPEATGQPSLDPSAIVKDNFPVGEWTIEFGPEKRLNLEMKADHTYQLQDEEGRLLEVGQWDYLPSQRKLTFSENEKVLEITIEGQTKTSYVGYANIARLAVRMSMTRR